KELTAWLARSPDHRFQRAAHLRLMHLAQQCRQDMGVLQAEVIPWPIEIGRHDTDRVETVLPAIRLAHLEPGNLCDGVRLIGRLQRAGEQAILRHRLRRVPWVYAARAQEEQLAHTAAPGAVD